MLTRDQLAQLERSLRATKVLSVYLAEPAANPAERNAWRVELDGRLAVAREALTSAPHDEREAFDTCVAQLRLQLKDHVSAPGAPGWVGFFTAVDAPYVETLPVQTPMLVAWDDGARVAPYVRALKQHVPVIVAILDAAEATLYRYAGATLGRLETIQAPSSRRRGTHMGAPARTGFHTGTRGATGAEEADRERRAAADALRRALLRRLEAVAGEDAWVALGGVPSATATALRALPERLRRRAHRGEAIDVHATEAEIALAARRVAKAASRERDLAMVRDLLGREAADGRGATGWPATSEALREHAVDTLALTGTFVRLHPTWAEALVRLAFEQAATVTYVSAAAAAELDEVGGVGALLRFVPARRQPPVAEAAVATS